MKNGDKVVIRDTTCSFQGKCRSVEGNGLTCVGLTGTLIEGTKVQFWGSTCSAYRKEGCLEFWVTHL